MPARQNTATPGNETLLTVGGERVDLPYRWSIRKFAEMFDTTARAIRFYETKGLLAPERDSSGRVFGLADFLRVERILRAKRLGFTLDDIREVFEVIDGDITDANELMRRKSNFETVLRGLSRRRADIDAVRADMTELCDKIDRYVETPRENTTFFRFAKAYEDRLTRSLSPS
jgi:DNA-binding transcriptional MerR regulator